MSLGDRLKSVGRAEDIQIGLVQGIEQGVEQGEKSRARFIVKNLLTISY